MAIDIVAEAEAVAAARWQATEPPPERADVAPGGGQAAPASIDARATVAPEPAEPWVLRHLLRLDERLLNAVVLLAILILVGTTVLTGLTAR